MPSQPVPPTGTFADERLIERIKVIAGDPHTDPRVKKKNMQVLGSWYIQFKDDPRMRTVAGLYKACGGGGSGGAAAKQVSWRFYLWAKMTSALRYTSEDVSVLLPVRNLQADADPAAS